MKKHIGFISIALATTLYGQTVQKIEFQNLSRMSSEIALETVNINVGDTLDSAKVNKAIKAFYNYGYFDDIQANDNEGVLEFIFKEKPSIANVELSGYKTRQEDIDAVVNKIGLSKGTMYTKTKVEQAKEALLAELQREGYVNSVIEVGTQLLNDSSVTLTIEVNKGDEIIIKKVNYFGANFLDASDFEEVTANKEEEIFPWFFGQNDGAVQVDHLPYEAPRISELYFEKGFLDAVVKPPFLKVDFASNESKLDFFIEEGMQYKTSNIQIFLDSNILDPQTLYSGLKTKNGKVFNLKFVREDTEYIKTKVADLGYAYAQVKFDIQRNQETGEASIVFSVIPGKQVYINDVFISGNARTLDRVIRRDIFLAHGDLFSLTDYNDSIQRLKRTGFFETVTIDQKRISEDKMDLIVKVKEVSTGSIVLGGGYGSYDGFILNASINERNVFGSGLNVGVSFDNSDRRTNYSFSLSNPAIRDSEYSGKIKVYSSEQDIEYSNDFGDYELYKQSTGMVLGFGREIFRNLYAGIDYKIETVEEKYDYESNYSGVRRPTEDYLLSSLTPYINFNNTNNYYFPTSGFNTGLSAEYAGVGGDAEYIEGTFNLKYYYSLKNLIDWDTVFRYRTKVQVIYDNGYIPYGNSLYMGGPTSLRGYESYAFGPDYNYDTQDEALKQSWTNGFELNFPLIDSAKMRWGVFYDYGMIGKDSFSDIQRSSVGALVEWISPFGPIQFIFANPLDDEPGDDTSSFEFSLGTSF